MKYLILAVVFQLMAFTAFTQNDPKAKVILDKVAKTYKGYSTLSADFGLEIENTQEKIKEKKNGKIVLKGKMFRIDLGAQKIFSDGKSLYTHLVEEKELQISTLEENEDEISPSNIFTFYQKGFNYTFLEEKIENGRTVQYIDLTPVKKQVSYFKIRLCVDKATSHISSAKIFDKNGSRYTYSVSKLVPNPPVQDNLFVYSKANFPGVDVVDLR